MNKFKAGDKVEIVKVTVDNDHKELLIGKTAIV